MTSFYHKYDTRILQFDVFVCKSGLLLFKPQRHWQIWKKQLILNLVVVVKCRHRENGQCNLVLHVFKYDTLDGPLEKRVAVMKYCIQLFRERLSGKVHATILKGIVGGFEFSFFQRNLKELARKAMEMCLRVLKESNKSRFDSYSRQEQCIDHLPYYLSGLSSAHFFRQPYSK